MTSSYDDYSLQKLEEWVGDVMSCDIKPEQIYNTIIKVIAENVEHHSQKLAQSTELLSLLNGKKKEQSLEHFTCYSDDETAECQKAWNEFWENNSHYNEVYSSETQRDLDKVVKWQLPVEEDSLSGEYFVCFPNDLLESANLKEGEMIEWVDQGDGSYLLKKATNPIEVEKF